MITLFYGPDSYRRTAKVQELVSAYTRKHPNFVLQYFDAEEMEDLEPLRDFLAARSMFEPVKMAVVKHVCAHKERGAVKELLTPYLTDDEVIIMLNEDAFPKGFAFLERAPVKSQVFAKLSKEKVELFIQQEAAARSVTLPPALVDSLADTYGDDSWEIVHELEKFSLQTQPEISLVRQDNFFSLLNGLMSARGIHTPLVALERLLSKKEEPVKVFNILAAQCVRRGYRVEALAAYDVAVKSGKLEYETALLDFCLS